MIFAGKIKVALVMRRASKDGARTIIHQHEIGDIDRQMPAGIKRVLHREPGVETALFGSFNVGSSRAAFSAFFNKALQIGRIGCQLLRDRMIRGDCDKACAEHRIGARRKYVDAVSPAGKTKSAFQPLRFADPVFLH